MAKDVGQYCSQCVRCQTTKALSGAPAPLQSVIASRPWEIVAVDVLKAPMSLQGNEYILVAQDYFTKWPFAVPTPDQRAERIVRILKDQISTIIGPPEKLHSDQGKVSSYQNSAKHSELVSLAPLLITLWRIAW